MLTRLFEITVEVEAALFAFMLVVLVFHSQAIFVGRIRQRHRLEEVQRRLVASVNDDSGAARERISGNIRLNRSVLEQLAGRVTGEARERVARIADEMGILEASARRCRSRWWWVRLQGVREFSIFGGGSESVPPHLRDANPSVRAAAIAWVVGEPTDERVEQVVLLLDDPDRRCRFVAQDTLRRIGTRSVVPLIRYLENPKQHARDLALSVAVGIADSRFLDVALKSARDPDPNIRISAADLLARIAGPAAQEALISLLGDNDERVRSSAARGLGSLRSWPTAPHLAAALADSSWDVRREAALALSRIGPGGRLYLRRALRHDDLFASEMAKQALGLLSARTGRNS